MQLKSHATPTSTYHTALVPFADMLNHHPAAHIREKVFDESRGVSFHTFLPCSKDTELFLNYGELHNKQLLQFYGFLSDDVAHLDTVALTLDPYSINADEEGDEGDKMDADDDDGGDETKEELQEQDEQEALADEDELIEKKGRLLDKYELNYEHSLRSDVIPSKLISTLRILVANAVEVETILSLSSNPLSQMINPKNELKAWKALNSVVEGLLAAYSTTLEEDEVMLMEQEDNQLSLPSQLGVRYRIIEKKILNNTLKLIQLKLDSLRQ
eukprot:TRINITY_DN2910_c0_g2_i1.p1 TRINITY_DN2910_c0_g2~~TRINITY_DN2910_c0_g2_i1.p1  ORF type:complete len:316 (+),score=95.91 TRINITY_DN2910_c0_g2_i1:138-950(+)